MAGILALAVLDLTDMLPTWLTDNLPRLAAPMLPTPFAVTHLGRGVVFATSALLFLGLLILLLAHIRHKRRAETSIHADRLEMSHDKAEKLVIHWVDILRQGDRADDVWLERQGRGESGFDMFRFDIVEDGKRKAVRLFCHLNPLGRFAPTYVNVKELRHAFLVAMLRAQPAVRVQAEVYALCEVHPATLRRSRSRKWVMRLVMASTMLVLMGLVMQMDADTSLWWMIGATLAAILSGALLGLALQSMLFISPEDARAVTERRRLPGSGKVPMRLATNFPSSDERDAESTRPDELDGQGWVEALLERRRPDDVCPWKVLEGWQWSRLLGERPELAPYCCWEKLDGEDWAFLLAEQPGLAEHCDWQALSPSDWATLLASQSQFLPIGRDRFRWEELEGVDWSELLGSQPGFSSHCDFTKLNGTDWAFLLSGQPQFAERCSWEKLDDDDWDVLLRAQPQLRGHKA